MTQFSGILIGEKALLIACGDALRARGHLLAAIVSEDRQICAWAQGLDVPIIAPGEGLADRLETVSADWLFNIAGLNLLSERVITHSAKGAINFHDGPLPRYAGLNAPVWALLAGESSHAVTWHMITPGVDMGDILLQAPVEITDDDTALTLNAKCFSLGAESFEQLIDMLADDTLTRREQDLSARTFCRRDDRPSLAGHLDFSRPADELARLVRAMDHGPYWNPLTTAKVDLNGTIACVGVAQALADRTARPGTVLDADTGSLVVACGQGAVRLSGLTCQQGLAIAPILHVETGTRLVVPPARLTGALARVVSCEAGWRAALRDMRPARILAQDTNCDDPTVADSHLTLQTDLPKAERPQLIRAFGAAIAADQDGAVFDLAYSDAGLAEVSALAPRYLSNWVPIQLDLSSPRDEFEAGFAERLERLDRAPGFALDIAARDPQLGPIEMPAAAICNAADLPQAAIVLHLDAPARLSYHPARLSHARAAQIAARMAQLVPLLGAGPAADQLAQIIDPRDPASAQHDTARDYDRVCIHAAFEAQVARTPDAIALVFEGQSLTYGALDIRANRVAHLLIDMGVTPDTPVALCVRRGPELLIGALGILKAGGAYVPMDPTYPSERLAHFLGDSGAPVIVTQSALVDQLPAHGALILSLDTDIRIAARPQHAPVTGVSADNLAYLIYTSGSTGLPKGVMVEHGNVANFFAGMDDRIRHDPPGVWLAVTSLSFDISVLELFWTLARGFKLVLMGDEDRAMVSNSTVPVSEQGMEFSLFYWGNDDGPGAQKYRLLLDGARFADTHGFCAVWTPERHFHAFGGPFPNPAVTGAAVAAVTRNIAVRAGSCVAPLHHPIRIAEEWAVVDNLTNGRTGMGIASGWHPVDFVLRPENQVPNNKTAMLDTIDILRRLWRGDEVEFDKGDGMVPIRTQPRPVSKELPLWLTTAGNPETWREAGRLGANVLTHLLGQSIAEVAEKITIYHAALREAGHDPVGFSVTLMLHTYVARNRDHAREVARGPMKGYLRAAAALVKQYAWAFPAFKRPEGAKNPMDIDLSSLSEDEVNGILDYAFNRYFEDSGLFGTVDDCLKRVEALKAIGVTEIACLIDYGIAPDQVLEALYPLAEVLARSNAGAQLAEDDFSIAAQIRRHKVTHLQCTPSMARMLVMNDDSRSALGRVPNLMVGGEALPGALARELCQITGQPVQNMYGPTETTIWSSTQVSEGGEGVVGIGTPIANTRLHVLDGGLLPVPSGGEGELYIGGDGVTRGYWKRPELTSERFLPDPSGKGRIYRTGDLVRYARTGRLEFMGRVDHQVKIRGHRIELGEIEAALDTQPGIRQAVVIAREDVPGDMRLVAYYTGSPEGDLRAALGTVLPAHMLPQHYVPLSCFPLTPNKKIDRKALPAPTAGAVAPDRAKDPDGASPNQTYRVLETIWQDVLGVEHVGRGDNFFNLGGHSLLAVQMHREIRERLAIPGLSITDVFRFPVLDALARHLESKRRPLDPAPVSDLRKLVSTPASTPGPAVRADDHTRTPIAASGRLDLIARRRELRAKRAGQG